MITLENDYLSVNISLLGAELVSLRDKRDGLEHMWSADPKFWPRRAPILFPCVGESRNGKIQVKGQDYPMGRHGFTRMQVFEVVEHSENKAVFELKENEETLKSYPFKFSFRVTYQLLDNTLVNGFEVLNSGDELLGFQLGGHPAFAVPFQSGEDYSDYEIRFDQALNIDRHLLNEYGLYNGQTRNVLKNSDRIPLSYELFNEDALVFKDIPSKRVWIQHKAGGKKLQVDYDGFPHLGIWSKPGADYVCIEPWIGCADGQNSKEDLFGKDNVVKLEPTTTFCSDFKISLIHES